MSDEVGLSGLALSGEASRQQRGTSRIWRGRPTRNLGKGKAAPPPPHPDRSSSEVWFDHLDGHPRAHIEGMFLVASAVGDEESQLFKKKDVIGRFRPISSIPMECPFFIREASFRCKSQITGGISLSLSLSLSLSPTPEIKCEVRSGSAIALFFNPLTPANNIFH